MDKPFELNQENCIEFLLRLVTEKCCYTLSLKEAELVNRGVRFLRKQD